MTPVGFSHSEISGSKPVCDSPELFAANHVLHRLLTPRHSSCALSSLTTNLLCGTLRGFRASRDELRLAKPGCAHAICEPWELRAFAGIPRKCWMVVATINYRDTPSQIVTHCWVTIPAPSSTVIWPTDAVQGRDRSSSNEPRSLDSIRRSFSSLKTRFRVVVFIRFSKNFRGLSTLDEIDPREASRVSVRDLTSLRFGGA